MKSRKMLQEKRARRAKRTAARIRGTAERPRMAVYRSNKAIYVQLINDEKGITLVSASTYAVAKKKGPKTNMAKETGILIAGKAKEAGIKSAVFDRRAYRYHGRIKAVAEGAKEGGLKI